MSWRSAVLLVVAVVVSSGCGGSEEGSGGGAGGSVGPTGTTGATGTPGRAGPTARACDALVPHVVPAPGERVFDRGLTMTCLAATSSAGGALALGLSGRVLLVDADGTERGSAPLRGGIGESSALLDLRFHPAGDGWQGSGISAELSSAFQTWDSHGVLVGEVPGIRPLASVEDGAGGSVVIGTAADGGGPVRLLRVGTDGALLWLVPLDRWARGLFAERDTGHVLVVAATEDEDAWARWFSAEGGGALTDWFPTQVSLGFDGYEVPFLERLFDGRIALSDGTSWIAAFRDLETAVEPPPDWLARRDRTRLSALVNGKGYALMSSGVPGSPDAFIELLTRDGESCGTVALEPGAVPPGDTRRAYGYWVGEDGTLFEVAQLDGATRPHLGQCAFRWWTGLFRR